MQHELRRFDDAASVARGAAAFVAECARTCVEETGHFSFAASGGRTPWAMFDWLATMDVSWEQVTLYQVDERIAPVGDSTRNLTSLVSSLNGRPAVIEAMPVNDDDLEGGATTYGNLLPERIDLVHLGLGPDGHTASLIPGDPVLDITDRLVALTGVYHDERRMTMTYPALARANQLLWLVTGDDKQTALARLLGGDTSIPAGRVVATSSTVMADASALRS